MASIRIISNGKLYELKIESNKLVLITGFLKKGIEFVKPHFLRVGSALMQLKGEKLLKVDKIEAITF